MRTITVLFYPCILRSTGGIIKCLVNKRKLCCQISQPNGAKWTSVRVGLKWPVVLCPQRSVEAPAMKRYTWSATGGLNFLGRRCWTGRMLETNGTQKTKKPGFESPNPLGTRLRAFGRRRSGGPGRLCLGSAPGGRWAAFRQRLARLDTLAPRGGYAGSLHCSWGCLLLLAERAGHPVAAAAHGWKGSSPWLRHGTVVPSRLDFPREKESRYLLLSQAFLPAVRRPRGVGCCKGSPLGGHLPAARAFAVSRDLPPWRAWRQGTLGGLRALRWARLSPSSRSVRTWVDDDGLALQSRWALSRKHLWRVGGTLFMFLSWNTPRRIVPKWL